MSAPIESGRPPVIGLSTSELRRRHADGKAHEHGSPTPSEFALGVSYVRAIEDAGGLPVILPPVGSESLDPILAAIDGLCLPGGPDLDPATYEAEPHPETGPFESDVDRFEMRLIRRADETGVPIFAICRGAQALNVARGGTLIQHLPDHGEAIRHRQTEPGTQTAHDVEVVEGSRLAAIVGAGTIPVNTFHHQGIDELGRELRAVAFAPDGTVEALEADDREFVLGVQWHAETLTHLDEQARLFRTFVEAAAAVAAGA